MNEIRIYWNMPGRVDKSGQPVNCGHWHADTPSNRQMLEIILESGLEIYGAGTHWVDVKKKPASSAGFGC